MSIRIAIAEDHPVYRRGMVALLRPPEFEVVAESCTGLETIEKLRTLRPDVLLLDLCLDDDIGGIDVLAVARREKLDVRILVVSNCEERAVISTAMRLGADGYALKNEPAQVTLRAIRGVAAGVNYVVAPRTSVLKPIQYPLERTLPLKKDELTLAEQAVFQLLPEYSRWEISNLLGISTKTFDVHRASIRRKLECQTNEELVRFSRKCRTSEDGQPGT